jgi:hypothetical protein
MTLEKESRQVRRARERREAKRPGFVKSFASRSVIIIGEGGDQSTAQHVGPKSSTPSSLPDTLYLLFCRIEDDDGNGFHVITGADSPEEGDWLARELQPIVRTKLSMGAKLSTRCELVANTDAATTAWANHSVHRKQTLTQFGENRR